MKEYEKTTNSQEEKKNRIRERYKGISRDELEFIPAKPKEKLFEDTGTKRVCAYCRVSTDDANQTSSYELQKNHYEDMIKDHQGWELVGIYADEGISGTSLQHRDEFIRMIQDCKDGKIDLIVTKSVSRFARNIVDCIAKVRELASMNPQVGVFFETEHIYTLGNTSEMMLAVLSAAAQEESHTKSEIMNISIEQRFSRGIFLTPKLLGYDIGEDGNLEINEEEAETVRLCFYLFLNGFPTSEIVEIMMQLSRPTKTGNLKWTTSTVVNLLKNERYCGDVLSRKTFTPNYLDHKSKKNRHDRNQYRQMDHHEAIVERGIYQEAGEQILLFNLKEPEVLKREVIRNDLPEKEIADTEVENDSKTIIRTLFPEQWRWHFGNKVEDVTILQRVHYYGNWDVLRPARVVKGMDVISEEVLQKLNDEAQYLIEKMRCAV